MRVVNLSNHPFVNERPVRRFASVLWLIGAVLIAMNIFYYWTYWLESAEARGKLSNLKQEVDESTKAYGELREQVSNLDVSTLNNEAVFLNQLIEIRTFPWSQLFDDLEEVLEPHYQVRLLSVQPEQETKKASRSRKTSSRRRGKATRGRTKPEVTPAQPKHVSLQLSGVSKSSEAMLDLIDTLFAHAAFRNPNLRAEVEDEASGLFSFDIGVTYLTHIDQEATDGDTSDGAESGGIGDDGTETGMAAADTEPAGSQAGGTEVDRTQEGEKPQALEARRAAASSKEEKPAVNTLREARTRPATRTPPSSVTRTSPAARTPPVTRTPTSSANPTLDRTTSVGGIARVAPQPLRPRPVPPPPPSSNRPLKAQPAQAQPAQAQPAQAQPAQAQPTGTESARPEPTRIEPERTEPAKPEPAKPEPANREPDSPQPNFDSEVASGTPRLKGGA